VSDVKRIILSPNPYRDRGLKAALVAKDLLEKQGIETVFCLPFRVEKDAGLPSGIRFCNISRGYKRRI
jgi:NAD+ kinase